MTQTVFVTGASSGIGRATVDYFAARGWNVAATMRDPAKARDLPPAAFPVRLDVTDHASIRDALAAAKQRFKRIDAVVNNAGYGAVGPFEASTPEDVDRQLATNVTGLMNLVREILPDFRAQRAGTIVNVASMGGRITFPLYSVYHASKWAVEGFTESIKYELDEFNIRVKIIEPGPI